jgi:hypothetical protein
MDLTARLEALTKAPKPWNVVSYYEDGRQHILPVRNRAAADQAASIASRKLNKNLIDRETGATVRIVRVSVEAA